MGRDAFDSLSLAMRKKTETPAVQSFQTQNNKKRKIIDAGKKQEE